MNSQIISNLTVSWKDVYENIDQDRIEKISMCPFISKFGLTKQDNNIDKKYVTIFFAFIERIFLNYQIDYIDHIHSLMESRKRETNFVAQIDVILNYILYLKKNFISEQLQMNFTNFTYFRCQIYQLIENDQLFEALVPFALSFFRFQQQQNYLQLDTYDKENVQKLCNILKMNIKVLLIKPDKITISANKSFPENKTKMDKSLIIVDKNKQSIHVGYDCTNERLYRFFIQGKFLYEQRQQLNLQQAEQYQNKNHQIEQHNQQLQQENQSLKLQIKQIQEQDAQTQQQNSQLKQQVQKYEAQEQQLKQVFEKLKPLLQNMLDNQSKQIEQLMQFVPNRNLNNLQNDPLSSKVIQLNNAELQLKQQLQKLLFPEVNNINMENMQSQINNNNNSNSNNSNYQWIQRNQSNQDFQQSQLLINQNNQFNSQQNFNQSNVIKLFNFEDNMPQIQSQSNLQSNYQFSQYNPPVNNQIFARDISNPSSRVPSNQSIQSISYNQINNQQAVISNENSNKNQNSGFESNNSNKNSNIDMMLQLTGTIKSKQKAKILLDNEEDSHKWTMHKQIVAHRKKEKMQDCPICCQTKVNQDFLLMKCGHLFCNECLQGHINSLISQGKRSFEFFTCLHCSLQLNSIELFNMLTDQQKIQIDEYYKDRNINFKCPNQKCGMQSKIQEKECLVKEWFITSCCKSQVCSKCKQIYHPDTKCQSQIKEIIEQIEAYRNQQTTENARLFRFCPVCSQFAFKDEGCDHVTCIKCKSDFCFSCSAPRPSILGHGNHYHREGCHYFCEFKDSKGNKVDNELNLKKCVQCQKTKKPCKRPIGWNKFLDEVKNEVGPEIFEAFPDNYII